MLLYKARVSKSEHDLINLIRTMGHGEIYSPTLKQEIHDRDIEVSGSGMDLLRAMRDGLEISILTVYKSEPVLAEVDEVVNGFRCRKKVKFPTV